jgi:phage-related protein (TIGR01555 family)
MFNWLRSFFAAPAAIENKKPLSVFSEDGLPPIDKRGIVNNALANTFQKPLPKANSLSGVAMDESLGDLKMLAVDRQVVPYGIMAWYGAQSFIGYQLCAMIAQNWLVDKACTMPGRDAIRKGFDITVNDGSEIAPEVLDAIRQADVKYKLNDNLVQAIRMSRIFGIRIVFFEIESDDEEFYYKPFNLDGVKPGSYKGITQVDPYWITPELDQVAAADPASRFFYEPTYWRISGGRRIHRSHLIIIRTCEVADILKPTYLYGGISIPQRIFSRVYAAERVADEAPQLVMTKRTNALHVSVEETLGQPKNFQERIEAWAYFRDNYGVKVLGIDEKFEQHDTTLSDLDAVIMTQYQLVAAIANVPAVKLLGTSPKGFNTTGEFEEANYHEELESIQAHDLTPLVERHHLLLIHSEIAPRFKLNPFATMIKWKSLDSMTAKEKAELNKIKADTASVHISSGVLSGEDERQRLINDPESEYNGISLEMEEEDLLNDLEEGEVEALVSKEKAELVSTDKPEINPITGTENTIQQESLNGAQITSLVGVLNSVASGELPPDAGRAIITAAFPLTAEQVDAMINPVIEKAKNEPVVNETETTK